MLQKLTRILGIYALGGIIVIFSMGFFPALLADLSGIQVDPPKLEGMYKVWCNSVGYSTFIWILLKPIQLVVKFLSNKG